MDFGRIVRAVGLTERDLRRRARELSCATTFRLFSERCDPIEGRLDLTPPTRWDRLRWGAAVMPERGHPGVELLLVRALDVPLRALDMLRAIPSVMRAVRSVRTHGPVDPMEDAPAPGDREILSYRQWSRLRRGVKRDLMLIGAYDGPEDPRFVVSLAFALRARGVGARMRCRVGESGADDLPACWIDVGGRRLPIGGVEHVVPDSADV